MFRPPLIQISVALSAVCLSLSIFPALADLQEWTREKDKATFSAELINYDADSGKVTVKMPNGNEVTIEKAILIKDHRERLDEYVKVLAEREKELAAKREAAKDGRMESFTPEDGGGHKIHIYYPAGYIEGEAANKRRPACFLYSPGGRSIGLVNKLKQGADKLGWVLVGVDCYKNGKDFGIMKPESVAAQKEAMKRVDYDPERVVYGGFSGGAVWAFLSASFLNEEAAGILSFGGWMGNKHDRSYSKNMAVAMINGDSDKNARFYERRDGDFLEKKTRATTKVFTFEGGHKLPDADVADEAMTWVHETKEFPAASSYY